MTVSLLPMKFETEIKKTSPGRPVRSSAELAIDYADDDHDNGGDEERLPPREPTRRWRDAEAEGVGRISLNGGVGEGGIVVKLFLLVLVALCELCFFVFEVECRQRHPWDTKNEPSRYPLGNSPVLKEQGFNPPWEGLEGKTGEIGSS